MKTLILAAIRCSLMFTAVAALSVQPAQAYMVTLDQVGSNVVATGSGAINLTGLTFVKSMGLVVFSRVDAASGTIATGPASGISLNLDEYSGFTGPTSFGSGANQEADSGSGDFVEIIGTGFLFLPQGYVSGTALSDSMIFNGATIHGLGLTPGTYTWTWGNGLPNQNFTLIIGGAGVPDGGTTVSLLSFALLGLAALRRKLRC
jgi:VPDSG-CTERM motif